MSVIGTGLISILILGSKTAVLPPVSIARAQVLSASPRGFTISAAAPDDAPRLRGEIRALEQLLPKFTDRSAEASMLAIRPSLIVTV